MKKLTIMVLVMIAFTTTACTPTQVRQHFMETTGDKISIEEAEEISEWINTQDCLPAYQADQYTECAIKDSWEAYNVPVSLETWARIAYCESALNPLAKNSHSSASGLYQNLARYWDGRAEAAGFPGGSIWNPRIHAFVSAHLAESDGVGHWNASGHCW